MPPRIVLIEGDITHQAVDAIVNAANTSLRPGGGVDGAITRAAGAEALAERERLIDELGTPPLPTGRAVFTSGGDLRARWIIHTAGPIYSGVERDREQLAACHVSCLALADELGATAVAFPAISTGIYGYPVSEAAPVALGSVLDAITDVQEVRFVLFSAPTLTAFRVALEGLGGRW